MKIQGRIYKTLNNYIHPPPTPPITKQSAWAPPIPPPPPTARDCQLVSRNATNPFVGECGRYNTSRAISKIQPLVIGGKDAARGQISWQAQMRGCGATIISQRHLLTAAHCVRSISNTIGSDAHVGHITHEFYTRGYSRGWLLWMFVLS